MAEIVNQGDISRAPVVNVTTNTVYTNPTDARLASATQTSPGGTVAEPVFDFPSENVDDDWRVSVTVRPSVASYLMSNTLMYPLGRINGVIFPYTPQIMVTHLAKYGATTLTHSNYSAYFYEGSEVQQMTIAGEFTAQNRTEGAYVAAAIQFFRTVSKMFFGQSPLAGTPPPIVYLNGYGEYGSPGSYFPSVPCVLTNFTHTLPSDADYISVPLQVNGVTHTTRVPTVSNMSIVLQPIYSRNNIQNGFTLEKFASGEILSRGFI